MFQLQKLAKSKLEIDFSKLQVARDWGVDAEQVRYWSRRKRLEKAYREAHIEAIFHGNIEALEETRAELLAFYLIHGVKYAKKI